MNTSKSDKEFSQSEGIQTFGDEQEASFSPSIREISPQDRLQFAKWVLRGIFIFFLVSIAVSFYQSEGGDILFEICRTGLLPIASFVIGDYFGSRGR
jgi:hypothetical protein